MAKLVLGLQQSLDGYVGGVDGALNIPAPDPVLFRHFVDWVGSLSASLYGRRTYELMRYWDEDRPEWNADEREFAVVWRRHPKWVMSRTLTSVGPNATLVAEGLGALASDLKTRFEGEIEVAGPELAAGLTELGLIDEYRLYFRPFVLGEGKPFFKHARPPLSLLGAERLGEDAVLVRYAPA